MALHQDTDTRVIALVVLTLTLGIPFDALGPRGAQTIVNLWTWGALAWVMWRSTPAHRRELAACVVLATLGELFLMEVWGLYHYRLHNLPLFIPAGHALVFTAAVRISRRVPHWFPWAVFAGAAPYVAWAAWTGIDTHPEEVAVAIVRGAFEYQGQKCSAASRSYIPQSMWGEVKERCVAMMKDIRMGDPRDFRNFMSAVIDKKAFDKIGEYLTDAKKNAKIIAGGGSKGNEGYFVEPTLIETKDPAYKLLCEEIFGPVMTTYAYPDAQWAEMLDIVDRTSPYALTGAIFATDRAAVRQATSALRNAAGNFYINDKPTGAVVGQQPFGGARASGTNDKAGSKLNLIRWVSTRTIKETFAPPRDHKYPFMDAE